MGRDAEKLCNDFHQSHVGGLLLLLFLLLHRQAPSQMAPSAREVVAGAQETMNVLDEEQTAKLNAARANSSPRYSGDALRKRRGVQALEACPSVLPYLILVSGSSSWLCDIRNVYPHVSRGTKTY